MRTLLFSFFLLAATSSANAQSKLSLSIAPERCLSNYCSISVAQNGTRTFYVVLTNQSEQPVYVWETSNSWGYRSISFEIILSDGKSHVLTLKPLAFDKNTPSTFKIPAGGHQVFPIRLDNQWAGQPIFAKTGIELVKVKAFFEITPSPEDSENKVWNGKVSSKTYSLQLNHW